MERLQPRPTSPSRRKKGRGTSNQASLHGKQDQMPHAVLACLIYSHAAQGKRTLKTPFVRWLRCTETNTWSDPSLQLLCLATMPALHRLQRSWLCRLGSAPGAKEEQSRSAEHVDVALHPEAVSQRHRLADGSAKA